MKFRLSLICCVLFCLVIVTGQEMKRGEEVGWDRPGEDYKFLDLSEPDPALCKSACDKDSRCKAYTYVKPGVQAATARCWLKQNVPPAIRDNCCVSGVKVINSQELVQPNPVQTPAPVPLPDFVGKSLDRIKEEFGIRLARESHRRLRTWFTFETEDDYSCKRNTGIVTSQLPVPNTLVEIGSRVKLRVSACVIVPPVIRKSVEEAQTLLKTNGLGFGTIEKPSNTATAGTVLDQSPPAGAIVPPGTVVTLTIATVLKIEVPDVRGQPLEDAKTVLTDRGLRGVTKQQVSREPLIVNDQDPKPGQWVISGGEVRLTVSSPPTREPEVVRQPVEEPKEASAVEPFQATTKMPNLVGRRIEVIRSDPEVVHLELGIQTEDDYASNLEPGVITKQSIQPGTAIKGHETVKLSVAARSGGMGLWIIGLLAAAAGTGYLIYKLAKKPPSTAPEYPSPEFHVELQMGTPEPAIPTGNRLVVDGELRLRVRLDQGIQKLGGPIMF